MENEKLDLGYIDRSKLMKYPWEWMDSSVEEMIISDVFPFVPADDRVRFMDELFRVLVPGGKATIVCIYYSSIGAISDFRVQWPPISEASFLYFNAEWRKANKVDTPMACDFDFTYGYTLAPEISSRHQDVQSQAVKADLNVVQRLHVVLTKKPIPTPSLEGII